MGQVFEFERIKRGTGGLIHTPGLWNRELPKTPGVLSFLEMKKVPV
jgi:hypothetical protein